MTDKVRVVMRVNSWRHKIGDTVEVESDQAQALIDNGTAAAAPTKRSAAKKSAKPKGKG